MSDFREEEALGKAYDAKLTRRLMRYMRPYKWMVLFALVLTLVVAPLEALSPLLYKVAIDGSSCPRRRARSNSLRARADLV